MTIRTPRSIRASVVLGAAAAVLATIAIAAPASASASAPMSPRVDLAYPDLPRIDTSDDDAVFDELESLVGTQSPSDIAAVLESGLPAAMLTDPDTAATIAAVVLPGGPRALVPVGPGCPSDGVCLTSASGTNYGLSGFGTRTGTWGGIHRATANGVGSVRVTWTAGAVTVPANRTNFWGAPVTVTKLTR